MLNHLQISALDLRLTLMAAVLVAMAVVFHMLSGAFLTPENLYNLAQQTAVVGIVATAVVLIIVARHIDLSVGSVLGFVGAGGRAGCADARVPEVWRRHHRGPGRQPG